MKIRTRKADLSAHARAQLNREWRQIKRERRMVRHLLGALHGGKVTFNRRTQRVVAVNGHQIDSRPGYPKWADGSAQGTEAALNEATQ